MFALGDLHALNAGVHAALFFVVYYASTGKSHIVTRRLKPEDYSTNSEIATSKRRKLREKKKKATTATSTTKAKGPSIKKDKFKADAEFINDIDDDEGSGGRQAVGMPEGTQGGAAKQEEKCRLLCTACGKPDAYDDEKHPLFDAPASRQADAQPTNTNALEHMDGLLCRASPA